jgi:hypothetical protein
VEDITLLLQEITFLRPNIQWSVCPHDSLLQHMHDPTIAFAQRNYTTHGNAQVVTYGDNDYLQRLYQFVSKSLQLWTSETTALGNHDSATSGSIQLPPLLPVGKIFLPTKGFDIFLTTDESAATWTRNGRGEAIDICISGGIQCNVV